MHADEDHRLPVERELAGQRLAAAPKGRMARIDAPGVQGQGSHAISAEHVVRRRCIAARARYKAHARRVVQKADADVGPRRAAVRAVLRVDLDIVVPRPAALLDGPDEPLKGAPAIGAASAVLAIVVLHLFDGEDVGRAEVPDDDHGPLAKGDGSGIAAQVGHVQGGDGELGRRAEQGGSLGGHLARAIDPERLGYQQLIVAKAIV